MPRLFYEDLVRHPHTGLLGVVSAIGGETAAEGDLLPQEGEVLVNWLRHPPTVEKIDDLKLVYRSVIPSDLVKYVEPDSQLSAFAVQAHAAAPSGGIVQASPLPSPTTELLQEQIRSIQGSRVSATHPATRSRHPTDQVGTVVGVELFLDLRFLRGSNLVKNVTADRIQLMSPFHEEAVVIHKRWIGIVEECLFDVTVRFPSGAVCLSSGDDIWRDYEHVESFWDGLFVPGQEVTLKGGAQSRVRWLTNPHMFKLPHRGQHGVVIGVVVTGVYCRWLSSHKRCLAASPGSPSPFQPPVPHHATITLPHQPVPAKPPAPPDAGAAPSEEYPVPVAEVTPLVYLDPFRHQLGDVVICNPDVRYPTWDFYQEFGLPPPAPAPVDAATATATSTATAPAPAVAPLARTNRSRTHVLGGAAGRLAKGKRAQAKREKKEREQRERRMEVSNLTATVEGIQALVDVLWMDGHRSQVWSNDLLPEDHSGEHDFVPGDFVYRLRGDLPAQPDGAAGAAGGAEAPADERLYQVVTVDAANRTAVIVPALQLAPPASAPPASGAFSFAAPPEVPFLRQALFRTAPPPPPAPGALEEVPAPSLCMAAPGPRSRKGRHASAKPALPPPTSEAPGPLSHADEMEALRRHVEAHRPPWLDLPLPEPPALSGCFECSCYDIVESTERSFRLGDMVMLYSRDVVLVDGSPAPPADGAAPAPAADAPAAVPFGPEPPPGLIPGIPPSLHAQLGTALDRLVSSLAGMMGRMNPDMRNRMTVSVQPETGAPATVLPIEQLVRLAAGAEGDPTAVVHRLGSLRDPVAPPAPPPGSDLWIGQVVALGLGQVLVAWYLLPPQKPESAQEGDDEGDDEGEEGEEGDEDDEDEDDDDAEEEEEEEEEEEAPAARKEARGGSFSSVPHRRRDEDADEDEEDEDGGDEDEDEDDGEEGEEDEEDEEGRQWMKSRETPELLRLLAQRGVQRWSPPAHWLPLAKQHEEDARARRSFEALADAAKSVPPASPAHPATTSPAPATPKRATANLREVTLLSGGQTGVDRAALDAALALRLPCEGWCPQGRLAEDGPLAPRYPLRETPSADVDQRTEWNVRDSEAVLILAAEPLAGGTALTRQCAQRLGRPLLVMDPARAHAVVLRAWLAAGRYSRLDVAGPRESEAPGIYAQALAFLKSVFPPPDPAAAPTGSPPQPSRTVATPSTSPPGAAAPSSAAPAAASVGPAGNPAGRLGRLAVGQRSLLVARGLGAVLEWASVESVAPVDVDEEDEGAGGGEEDDGGEEGEEGDEADQEQNRDEAVSARVQDSLTGNIFATLIGDLDRYRVPMAGLQTRSLPDLCPPPPAAQPPISVAIRVLREDALSRTAPYPVAMAGPHTFAGDAWLPGRPTPEEDVPQYDYDPAEVWAQDLDPDWGYMEGWRHAARLPGPIHRRFFGARPPLNRQWRAGPAEDWVDPDTDPETAEWGVATRRAMAAGLGGWPDEEWGAVLGARGQTMLEGRLVRDRADRHLPGDDADQEAEGPEGKGATEAKKEAKRKKKRRAAENEDEGGDGEEEEGEEEEEEGDEEEEDEGEEYDEWAQSSLRRRASGFGLLSRTRRSMAPPQPPGGRAPSGGGQGPEGPGAETEADRAMPDLHTPQGVLLPPPALLRPTLATSHAQPWMGALSFLDRIARDLTPAAAGTRQAERLREGAAAIAEPPSASPQAPAPAAAAPPAAAPSPVPSSQAPSSVARSPAAPSPASLPTATPSPSPAPSLTTSAATPAPAAPLFMAAVEPFGTVPELPDHRYAETPVGRVSAGAVRREWATLREGLRPGAGGWPSIVVRVSEQRMDLLRAMIVGPGRTPYEDGVFFFDIRLPDSFPRDPPEVSFLSCTRDRLNPNLYTDGKVCLSVLNTWDGTSVERWHPGQSTLLQVLLSIQGLVLNEAPFYNEAGFERHLSDPAFAERAMQYNENALLLTMETLTVTIPAPPVGFGEIVRALYLDVRAPLLRRLEGMLAEGPATATATCTAPARRPPPAPRPHPQPRSPAPSTTTAAAPAPLIAAPTRGFKLRLKALVARLGPMLAALQPPAQPSQGEP
ncbi:putative ubiquitin-conjugating enzyme [Paratrimastix pyriformis]|uniref:Ubiquitin-conjugating enzyme n=1 Tax=Paratrimastix pyriformis TaxID=342808 RepID=A0ABQ8ULJ2_9EUKA|nr:putative ubiquitin-conjugating enzyme [Paratrimastix pyriformis]